MAQKFSLKTNLNFLMIDLETQQENSNRFLIVQVMNLLVKLFMNAAIIKVIEF